MINESFIKLIYYYKSMIIKINFNSLFNLISLDACNPL